MSNFFTPEFNNESAIAPWNASLEPTKAIIPQLDANRVLTGGVGQEVNIPTLTPEAYDNIILPDDLLTRMASAVSTDSNSSLPDSSVDLLTGQAMSEVYEDLSQFAAAPDFVAKLNVAFGENWDAAGAKALAEGWFNGDFSDIPSVKVVSSAEIGGANGAFAAATDTIYLSQEFLARNAANSAAVADVLLEEIGHSVDSRLNVTDAPGDEGAILAAVVQGKELSKPEILALKSEDDTTTITLGGKTIFIEQSDPSDFNINLNSDYYNDGNKFVRINDTGGTKLWCTDFAFGRALEKRLVQNNRGLGGRISGPAGAWDDEAGSWRRQARANSFIVWDPNQGGAGSVGHVGFVERVNANGSFVISESNFALPMSLSWRTINRGTSAFNSAKFVYL